MQRRRNVRCRPPPPAPPPPPLRPLLKPTRLRQKHWSLRRKAWSGQTCFARSNRPQKANPEDESLAAPFPRLIRTSPSSPAPQSFPAPTPSARTRLATCTRPPHPRRRTLLSFHRQEAQLQPLRPAPEPASLPAPARPTYTAKIHRRGSAGSPRSHFATRSSRCRLPRSSRMPPPASCAITSNNSRSTKKRRQTRQRHRADSPGCHRHRRNQHLRAVQNKAHKEIASHQAVPLTPSSRPSDLQFALSTPAPLLQYNKSRPASSSPTSLSSSMADEWLAL